MKFTATKSKETEGKSDRSKSLAVALDGNARAIATLPNGPTHRVGHKSLREFLSNCVIYLALTGLSSRRDEM